MSAAATSFYVTGGTLRPDAPSYVERQADRDLREALLRGEFCYVLTARQMGKSSLMLHTATRLREEGVAVVILDLQAVGQNLSVEQWYDGLLSLVGPQLELEDELEAFWLAHPRLGPLQRWMAALRQVVLTRVPGPVVLFVDEIDAVRSLPFSADEFFAGVRECYNRRSQDPQYDRLTVCLLGSAAPADLISDTRISPFNIGRRIELTDFTPAEALPLAVGLGGKEFTAEARRRGEKHPETEAGTVLQRVLYWTGGHPYLTQRLCRAIAEADAKQTAAAPSAQRLRVSRAGYPPKVGRGGESFSPGAVDRLCGELFFTRQAREADDNLGFVRNRLLQSEVDLASLLDLYRQVQRGQRVIDDETNPLATLLKLSGVARAGAHEVGRGGALQVRNRIYARVFDRKWITAHMPDAELRRQRAAYRRGLLRSGAVFGLILAVIGALAFSAIQAESRAKRSEARATRVAEDRRQELYAAQMNLAQQALQAGNVRRARELLEAHRPRVPGQADLRGFEWRYLWRLCQDESLYTFPRNTGWINAVALSPDGKLLAAGGSDNRVRLWNLATRRMVATLAGHSGWSQKIRGAGLMGVTCAAFSPDGKTLAVGAGLVDWDRPGEVKLWDVATQRKRFTLGNHAGSVLSLAFSPDGRTLVTASYDRTAKLWDVASGRELATLRGHTEGPRCVAFSPNGKIVATGGSAPDQTVRLWDVASRRQVASFRATLGGSVLGLAFSPNGKSLATGAWDPVAKLWDVASQRQVGSLKGHRNRVPSVAFSPDGTLLATASEDRTVKLWDVARQRPVHTFVGHTAEVTALAFSPDGRTVVTGSADGAVKLWGVRTKQAADSLRGHQDNVSSVTFSPDGKTLASGSDDNTVKLWDVDTGRIVATFAGHSDRSQKPRGVGRAGVTSVAFSPDGNTLVAGTGLRSERNFPGEVKLWDVVSRKELATLRGHTASIVCVVFSPNGKTLATGGGLPDQRVRLWDVVRRRQVASFRAAIDGVVWGAVFSPDGKTLATPLGSDNMVKLWEIPSCRPVASLKTTDMALRVAFSRDGKTLAAGAKDGTVRLWETGSWRELGVLDGLAGWTDAVAFSCDGKTLATGHQDGTVMLWNLARRQVVAVLEGHDAAVKDAAFSPDGNLLATVSMDRTVRLWRAPTFAETDAVEGARRSSR